MSKLLKSIEVKALHLENKPDISVTLDVLKLLKSIEVKASQFENKEFI